MSAEAEWPECRGDFMNNNIEREDRRKGKREKAGANGVIMQIILSVIGAGVGALLLFLPGIQTKQLCYVFCGGMIGAGIVLIARFFITKAFSRLHDYSFSLGIFFLILGVCGILRIDVIDSHFQLTSGFLLLVLGVMVLQGMVQLNAVDNLFWILLMLFTTVTLIASVLLILDVQAVISLIPGLPYWLLFGAGVASLLSLLIVALSLFLYRRKMRKREEEGYTEEEITDEEPGAEEYVPVLPEPEAAAQEAASSAEGFEQLAGFAQQESVPTGETQIYPPISGSGAENAAVPAENADAVKADADDTSITNELSGIIKAAVNTADLPNIVPPEDL